MTSTIRARSVATVPCGIGHDPRGRTRQLRGDRVRGLHEVRRSRLDRAVAVHLGGRQDVRDQAFEPLGSAFGGLGTRSQDGVVAEIVLLQRPEDAHVIRRERGPELVRGGAHEVVLLLVRDPQLRDGRPLPLQVLLELFVAPAQLRRGPSLAARLSPSMRVCGFGDDWSALHALAIRGRGVGCHLPRISSETSTGGCWAGVRALGVPVRRGLRDQAADSSAGDSRTLPATTY